MLREMVGVIQLSKYRAMKREYLEASKRFDRSGEGEEEVVRGKMEELEKKGTGGGGGGN